jgi:hypothetical protein
MDVLKRIEAIRALNLRPMRVLLQLERSWSI